MVTTDLNTGAEIVIVNGPVAPALLASAALPGILPPVQLNGHTLVDGAVVNLVPISHALAGPIDRIFVLDVSDPISERPIRSPLDVVIRAFAISRDLRFELELQWIPKDVELCVLPAPVDDRDFFDFTDGQRLIDEAYTHAVAALDELETPAEEALAEAPKRASLVEAPRQLTRRAGLRAGRWRPWRSGARRRGGCRRTGSRRRRRSARRRSTRRPGGFRRSAPARQRSRAS